MPRNLFHLEDKIRKTVQKKLNRGKVDIYITQVILQCDNSKATLNKNLSDSYVKCLEEIKDRYKIKDELSIAFNFKISRCYFR